jgi:uncharacterized protein (DUF2249 family)
MSKKTVTLDVREDIRQGREPFSKIMQTVARLKPGENLRLLAPFQPVPLYGVLAGQGFSHTAKATAEGDWDVLFSREPGGAPTAPAAGSTGSAGQSQRPATRLQDAGAAAACTGTPVLDVDARGLEPPQPLVKILEALESLPQGAELRARTDRRPMHLYAQLTERGFSGETEEQPDGSFVTHVRRIA